MRISVEIDDKTLSEAMALTGEKNKSPAIARAVDEFIRRKRAQEFGRLIRESAFDYPKGKDSESLDPVHPLSNDD